MLFLVCFVVFSFIRLKTTVISVTNLPLLPSDFGGEVVEPLLMWGSLGALISLIGGCFLLSGSDISLEELKMYQITRFWTVFAIQNPTYQTTDVLAMIRVCFRSNPSAATQRSQIPCTLNEINGWVLKNWNCVKSRGFGRYLTSKTPLTKPRTF